jgi:hypothetical protein
VNQVVVFKPEVEQISFTFMITKTLVLYMIQKSS